MTNKIIKLEVGATKFVPKKENLPDMTQYWVHSELNGQPVRLAVRSRDSLLEDMRTLAESVRKQYACDNVTDKQVRTYSFAVKNYAKDNRVYSESDVFTTMTRPLQPNELEQLIIALQTKA